MSLPAGQRDPGMSPPPEPHAGPGGPPQLRGESQVSKKLYVGNLTYDTSEDDLVELFTPFGEVLSAQVIIDRDTNRSKGFAFVEMGSGADEAIKALSGQDFKGRDLTVNEARPREDRGGGGGRGGYGGGRGGGGGGRGGYGGGGGRDNDRYEREPRW